MSAFVSAEIAFEIRGETGNPSRLRGADGESRFALARRHCFELRPQFPRCLQWSVAALGGGHRINKHDLRRFIRADRIEQSEDRVLSIVLRDEKRLLRLQRL